MNSNFQSSVFMELIQKIRVLGVLTPAGVMLFRPQKAPFRARVDKAPCGGHNEKASQSSTCARMAELADALASGASDRKVVEVRVLFRAPISPHSSLGR